MLQVNKSESTVKPVDWRSDAISTVDTDVAIRVVDLAKNYSIQVDPSRSGELADGGKAAVYRTLSEGLADFFTRIRGRRHAMRQDRFAALQGVSFEVAAGSVVGIVGRNGAGKTTLLKVLSRVTEPTAGFAEVYGRVGTLLEVGTGFHPELTGRENVYLSGAILGMYRAEIDRKFDEIVAFAEVERFLEVPLKRYSTGMYLRLAFAVAAHLETEIMLVDEVLAVGDLRFRQRCLGKMRDVGQSGRTILFVSHDLSSVQQICERVIWLDKGEIVADGAPADVIGRYEAASHSQVSSARAVFERDPAAQIGRSVWVSRVELRDGTGQPNSAFNGGDVMRMILHIGGRAPADGYGIVWWIVNERGERVAHGASQTQQEVSFDREDLVIECELGPLWLTSGIYRIHVHLLVTHVVQWDEWTEAASFRIATTDPFGHGYNMTTLDDGAVAIPHRWRSLERA